MSVKKEKPDHNEEDVLVYWEDGEKSDPKVRFFEEMENGGASVNAGGLKDFFSEFAPTVSENLSLDTIIIKHKENYAILVDESLHKLVGLQFNLNDGRYQIDSVDFKRVDDVRTLSLDHDCTKFYPVKFDTPVFLVNLKKIKEGPKEEDFKSKVIDELQDKYGNDELLDGYDLSEAQKLDDDELEVKIRNIFKNKVREDIARLLSSHDFDLDEDDLEKISNFLKRID
jgi:hypothetical protein